MIVLAIGNFRLGPGAFRGFVPAASADGRQAVDSTVSVEYIIPCCMCVYINIYIHV